jgi:hypothetical protein
MELQRAPTILKAGTAHPTILKPLSVVGVVHGEEIVVGVLRIESRDRSCVHGDGPLSNSRAIAPPF